MKGKNNIKEKGSLGIPIFALICIIALEILAFKTSPSRGLPDLLRDIAAMFMGFLVGYLLSSIAKYIVSEFKLGIVFGFLFIGIGMVLNSLIEHGKHFSSYPESYYGLMLTIVFTGIVISMYMNYKK